MTPVDSQLSWCEVSSAALAHNVSIFRRRLRPGAKLGVVVKSNAYGHGIVLASRAFVRAGADWLIVNSLVEAETLVDAALDVPLYICGPVLPQQAAAIVETGARVVVYDADVVRALSASAIDRGRVVPVHIKIETGNTRQGLDLRDALALGELAKSLDGIDLEGISTHFADIEDTTDHTFAGTQLEAFSEAARAFSEAQLAVRMVHSANSAATILWPETHGDLVRVGISAYGLWP